MTVIEDSTFLKVKALATSIDSNIAEIRAPLNEQIETAQVFSEMLIELIQEIDETRKAG